VDYGIAGTLGRRSHWYTRPVRSTAPTAPLGAGLLALAASGCDQPSPELEDRDLAQQLLTQDPGGPAWVGIEGPLGAPELVMEAIGAMDRLQFARTEAMLDRAAHLDRVTGGPQFNSCMLHYHTYRFSEAEDLCSVAIAVRDPAPPYAYVLERGLVRIKLGKLDEAEQDFLHCKAIDPENAEAYYDHSWVFAARGDLDRTIEQIRLAGERDAVYTGREHVATDPPYERFESDGQWKRFLRELSTDAPLRVDSEWMESVGVAGVPEP